MAKRIQVVWVEGAVTTFKDKGEVLLKERGGKKVMKTTYANNLQPGDKVKFLPRHDCLTVQSLSEIEVG